MDKINLLNFDRAGLEAYFQEIGEPKFRATQLLKWMHQRGVTDFDQMTDLSLKLREKLNATAIVQAPEVVLRKPSNDGTRKWLCKMPDGNIIETVFIPEEKRGTLCVSSQVGCMLTCTFCSTGTQGFNRNLSTAEIIGQLWVAVRELARESKPNAFQFAARRRRGETEEVDMQVNDDVEPRQQRSRLKGEGRVTNIVMMGMGEPLMNVDKVIPAMNLMLDDNAYGLSRRRVTLSTSGVVPEMYTLAERSKVSLAVSLHAPNDALRDEIVPINRKYPLKELLKACHAYLKVNPHKNITFEYVMLDHVNDNPEQAHELVNLLKDLPSKMNLIPFNPYPGSPYQTSSNNRIHNFKRILEAGGLVTTIRKTRGDDIDAACGQLVGQIKDKTRRQAKHREKLLKQSDKGE